MKKSNLYLIVIFLIFLMLNISSQSVQAVILGLISVYAFFYWAKIRVINKWIAFFLLQLIFVLVFSLTKYANISMYYLISELKVLVIFTLPIFFNFIFQKTDGLKLLIQFFKIYSILVFILGGYGYFVEGLLRYTGFLQHSIYISVTLVLLSSYLFDFLNNNWKIITIINILMLGSSSGVLILVIAYISKLKIAIWKKVIPSILGAAIIFWYITDYRGREVFGSGFLEIDRVQIFLGIAEYTKSNFNTLNYLVGYGIGNPLEGFKFVKPFHSFEMIGFANWFSSFTRNGVYPFAFHNEFLRIFYDFGLIGLFFILKYLYNNLDKIIFIALMLACFTNTILYSTSGLFILSMLVAGKMSNIKKLNNSE